MENILLLPIYCDIVVNASWFTPLQVYLVICNLSIGASFLFLFSNEFRSVIFFFFFWVDCNVALRDLVMLLPACQNSQFCCQSKHGESAFNCYAACKWNKLSPEVKWASSVNDFYYELIMLLFFSMPLIKVLSSFFFPFSNFRNHFFFLSFLLFIYLF